MRTAIQLLHEKAIQEVHTVAPEASVFDALQLLALKNIGALLVVDNGRLVGIFSERDYARKIILLGKRSALTAVSAIMTTELIVVGPQTPGEECMALITERHVRHLPVLDQEKILGVLSIGDLVKERIAEQEYVIQQLEKYIYQKTP